MTHQISNDDVRHLAQLSAIALDESEVESLRTDIANILTYIEQLGELDTTDVSPTYQVTGLENVFRDDVVDNGGVDVSTILEAAPDSQYEQFKVPKVL
ncbi:MAG TPA: Asp-tRNA(Asn)/Glu-tRNA(Gln) amidotransferase subunit GatC [Patescibacteria group bacterium]|jgi:aspartyl-tRNA(Asn)/glutamyl-tRNA(Gln) amidotransferase subunit C|nr:Asp-tRNA(Asn)/Glu-tRNA(Gln) amidotransferase subunit GatC [Patescibacteria group bacterium]